MNENMWDAKIPIKDDYPDDLKELIRGLNAYEPQHDVDEYEPEFYEYLEKWNKEQAEIYGTVSVDELEYDDDDQRRYIEEAREDERIAAERKRQEDYEYRLYYLW